MAWWNYGGVFNPLNWPGDITSSFIHQLEGGLGYVISLLLNAFLTVINSIFGLLMSLFEGMVGTLVNTSIAMGPFALPVFSIGATAIIGGLFLAFGIVKDLPVVGAFV